MEEVCEGKEFHFPAEEEKVLKFWTDIDAFKTSLAQSEGKKEFVFYDGPPFATGLPHYGHILAGTIKDIVTRYAHSTGHHVVRRFGWDCHGLPVEYEIDKKLEIKGRDDVLNLGIDKYNEECRSIVMRYSKEWETIVTRLGRWIDFENDYKTLDPSFMESVWWVFKQLYAKDLVYQGFKVMPYSTACNTPLSNFEAGLNYKDVSDPAVMVSFPLVDDPDGAALVAWTTTPWTLPSNLALCVNGKFTYVKLKEAATGKVFIVAKSRMNEMPGMKKGKKGAPPAFAVMSELAGTELRGRKYEPLLDYFVEEMKGTAYVVVMDDYVTDDSGTGVVHQAPAYGEDDYRVCLAHGVIAKGEKLPNPVDDNGRFVEPVSDFKGLHVKEADKGIVAKIKEMGRLVNLGQIVHSYPFCWRSDTPLIYKAVPSWFVKVESIKDKLMQNNTKTYWVPQYVQEKRFHNWLENARDWAISRNRFWGTPIPIWMSPDGEEIVPIGSIAELEELSGKKVTDLHRHFIDDIEIPSKRGPGYPPLKRIDEVFDCWFESGSMPYAQQHYPFENKKYFEDNFPADFIAEGLDQTRGWFYTLMVLSTALFDKPAFKNLVCNGLVLAADGKKMSKRLKNYPPPTDVVDKYGADALRLYLINSPVVRAEPMRFKEEGVFQVVKDVFLPWYNAYRFLVQSARALEEPFVPSIEKALQSPNILDKWVLSSCQTLIRFVRDEMSAYRLYTVVPRLLTFIDDLTNTYVRLNRKRLKGKTDMQDTNGALSTLYLVLDSLNKVMSPFTPFFTENMYQNLRKACPGSPQSLHYCDMPEPIEDAYDVRIENSVNRMTKVIELGRILREKHALPIKSRPLKRMIVVHPDADFLEDITERLAGYVKEELNIQELEKCAEPVKYAKFRAEPEFSVLGKRLGKAMGQVGKAIKDMSEEQVMEFEKTGQVELAGHILGAGDIKVVREFRPQEGGGKMDANGDGDVLIVLDLEGDDSLITQGLAREVVNRVQKLRKKANFVQGDPIELYFSLPAPTRAESNGEANSVGLDALRKVFDTQNEYLSSSLSATPLMSEDMPAHTVVVAEEDQGIAIKDSEGEQLCTAVRFVYACMRMACRCALP
eukprot:scaffold439_cov415-Prasinococcus_capsulatus_cf.AAC.45